MHDFIIYEYLIQKMSLSPYIEVVNQKIFYNYKFARFVLISLPRCLKLRIFRGDVFLLFKAVHSRNRHVFVRRSCVFVRRSCVFVRRRGAPFGPLLIFHGSVTCFHGKATCFHGKATCFHGEYAVSTEKRRSVTE